MVHRETLNPQGLSENQIKQTGYQKATSLFKTHQGYHSETKPPGSLEEIFSTGFLMIVMGLAVCNLSLSCIDWIWLSSHLFKTKNKNRVGAFY